jgi:hypothetical protein
MLKLSPAAAATVLPTGLICSIMWLVYTTAPKQRTRSCGGNVTPCTHYGCDIGWDCLWAVLWGASFTRAMVVLFSYGRGDSPYYIADAVFSVVMFGLFASTAVLSAKVRGRVKAATGGTVGGHNGKDVEAPADIAKDTAMRPPGAVGMK